MSDKIITVIEPKDLVVDKCYRCLNDGKYMGKYIDTKTSGRSDDPEYIYNFTNGNGNTHNKPIFIELDCIGSNVDITCYVPNIINSKYQCPICKSVEGGTSRIITHNSGCQNNGKKYCGQSGGRKKRKTTKNNRKTTKNNRKK